MGHHCRHVVQRFCRSALGVTRGIFPPMAMIPFNLLANHCRLAPSKLARKMLAWGLPVPACENHGRFGPFLYQDLSEDEVRDVLRYVFAEQGRTLASDPSSDLETSLQELRSRLGSQCSDSVSDAPE